MKAELEKAYLWALNTKGASLAARQARLLAKHIQALDSPEPLQKNWRTEKFIKCGKHYSDVVVYEVTP